MATASKIEQMKVTELRAALEARGLETSGLLKAALVSRLQEAQQEAEVDKDEKVPTTNPSSDEDQPRAEEAEVGKDDEKESPPTANVSSNEDEVEKDKKMTTANAEVEPEEAEAKEVEDEDGEEAIPYKEPKSGGKAWRFVTGDPDKKASPQVSAALTALVDKYGSLKAAVAAGWQFVEKDGTAVSVTKTSGPHHMVAPGGGPDDILTSGQALAAIASEPMPANAAKRARSK